MKSIKNFKYWYTYNFDRFLRDYGYRLDDVEGFEVSNTRYYRGNILKTYVVHVLGGESVYFSVVFFKSFDEYNKTWLGLNGYKLLKWHETSTLKLYKENDKFILVD